MELPALQPGKLQSPVSAVQTFLKSLHACGASPALAAHLKSGLHLCSNTTTEILYKGPCSISVSHQISFTCLKESACTVAPKPRPVTYRREDRWSMQQRGRRRHFPVPTRDVAASWLDPAPATLVEDLALSLPLEEKERYPLISLLFQPKMRVNMHISEDKTNKKKWFVRFPHFTLLQFAVHANLHQDGIQSLQMVHPGRMTIYADLSCTSFILMEINFHSCCGYGRLKSTSGKNPGFYFWLYFQNYSAQGILTLQLHYMKIRNNVFLPRTLHLLSECFTENMT